MGLRKHHYKKVSGGDGITAELFQILKDDAVKVLHSICQQIWITAVATGLEKVSFHSNPKERQCQKCSNYHTIALISHASKGILKILQARLQQYVNREIPDMSKMQSSTMFVKSHYLGEGKDCSQYASKFGKLSSGHRTGKDQFSFQSQRKTKPKNAQTTAQLHSSHMLVK